MTLITFALGTRSPGQPRSADQWDDFSEATDMGYRRGLFAFDPDSVMPLDVDFSALNFGTASGAFNFNGVAMFVGMKRVWSTAYPLTSVSSGAIPSLTGIHRFYPSSIMQMGS